MGEMNGLRVRTVSTSLGEWISSGNEWSQSPCHPVSGSTCPGLAIGAWCGKGTAPGCAWCLRGAMLLRGCRLFGVALHREPKGTKRSRIYGFCNRQSGTTVRQRSLFSKTSKKGAITPIWNHAPGSRHDRLFLRNHETTPAQ